MTYKLTTRKAILRIADGANIPVTTVGGSTPLDPEGTDGRALLDWLAAGGIPAAADAATPADARLTLDDTERAACAIDAQVLPLVNQTKAEWITWAGTNFPSLTAAEKTRLGILFWVVSVGVRRAIRNGGA